MFCAKRANDRQSGGAARAKFTRKTSHTHSELRQKCLDAAVLKVAGHDGDLRTLGGLGDEGEILEQGVGRGLLDLGRGRRRRYRDRGGAVGGRWPGRGGCCRGHGRASGAGSVAGRLDGSVHFY